MPASTSPKLTAGERAALLSAVESAEQIANQLLLGDTKRAHDELSILQDAIYTEGHPVKKLLTPTGSVALKEYVKRKGKVLMREGQPIFKDSRQRVPTYGQSVLHEALSDLLGTLGQWHFDNYTRKRPDAEANNGPRGGAVQKYCKRIRDCLASANLSDPNDAKLPVLLGADVHILRIMAAAPGVSFDQYTLGRKAQSDRKTISKRLKYLRAQNYVTFPEGRKRGSVITESGLARLKLCAETSP